MSLGPVITKWGAGPRRAHARRTWGTLFALVLHTVRLQRRSALIWGLALGIYSAVMVATFPTFGDMEQLDQLMRAYPEDMGTPRGFWTPRSSASPRSRSRSSRSWPARARSPAPRSARPWTSCSATRCRAGSSLWAASSRPRSRSSASPSSWACVPGGRRCYSTWTSPSSRPPRRS